MLRKRHRANACLLDTLLTLKRESILVNIFHDEQNISTNCQNLERVKVARHHYTPKQLQFFDTTKKKPTTAVDIKTLAPLVHAVDKRWSYTDSKTGSKMYFNAPSSTYDDVKTAFESLESSCSERKARREEARMHEEEEMERNAFDEMTYEDYSDQQVIL